jgi:hypothetical protein
VDGEHGVAGVVLAGEEARLLEPDQVLVGPRESLADLGQEVVVEGAGPLLLAGELGERCQLVDLVDQPAVLVQAAGGRRMAGRDAGRPLGVVPQAGLAEVGLELGDAPLQRLGVKGSRPGCRRGA